MHFLKKEHYLDCKWMKHSIHFHYDSIRSCCTNAQGLVFYDNYRGEEIDWNYIYNKRKQCISDINSFFNKKKNPDFCNSCFQLEECLSNKKADKFDNIIDVVYFHQQQACNAKCTYCVYQNVDKKCKYKVLPIVKSMIEKKILSKNAEIYMSGGEITISSEFEELLQVLLDYLNSKVEILTSGIKYCKSIENAFINNKLTMMVSTDSASADIYKRIKRVDCFDIVIDNLRRYIKASDNAKKNITLKYILVDNINDNKEELINFLKLANELGIENVRLDLDFEKYKLGKGIIVPSHYYDLFKLFDTEANKYGLTVHKYGQVLDILAKK